MTQCVGWQQDQQHVDAPLHLQFHVNVAQPLQETGLVAFSVVISLPQLGEERCNSLERIPKTR